MCEEIANFSFYYHTYCHFVCTAIYKQVSKQSTHLQTIKRQLQFGQLDELLNIYLLLERQLLSSALT
jgi:hypothetical protein